jgi:Capsule polysaccharide biosynthesis protein
VPAAYGSRCLVRFLFTTLQFIESEFYGRVGAELEQRGHEVAHVVFSRRGADSLRRGGSRAYCLPELMAGLGPLGDVDGEARRIEQRYDTPTLRDVYRTDAACDGKPEAACVERTVRHFLALERIYDEVRPEVVVPEVGSETMRTASHLIGLDRGITVLFLFYTIFPRPLRLYANTMHAPIVPPDDLRELTPEERDEVESFIAEFTARAKPIRPHRRPKITPRTLRDFGRHVTVRLTVDRDNEYLRPSRFVKNYAKEKARGLAAKSLYSELDPGRPFVYFPLHVTDDYKIKRVIPHCVDQASLIEQVAQSLPHGYDLVLKEHPMSVGRNSLGMLRGLTRIENVRLLDPYTSSHELIQRAQAVAVISSTVGLEALMYAKPVLTLGQPFYSGYGVTLDVDSFREIREQVPALLRFHPDRDRILRFLHAAMRRCYPGAPVLVDSSDENAAALASSLDAAVREGPTDRALAAA